MEDREGWRERAREIRAGSVTMTMSLFLFCFTEERYSNKSLFLMHFKADDVQIKYLSKRLVNDWNNKEFNCINNSLNVIDSF